MNGLPQLTNLEHENVINDLSNGCVERENEGFVPDGRIGGRTDVGLFDLPSDRHSTHWADVVSLKLSALNDAYFQLHQHIRYDI